MFTWTDVHYPLLMSMSRRSETFPWILQVSTLWSPSHFMVEYLLLLLLLSAISELRATESFTDMSVETEEGEHSIEMHLPYIRKVFEG